MPAALSRITLCALALCAAVVGAVRPAFGDQITVFAAASLQKALGQIAQAWQQESGHNVVLSFAGSATLARQVQAGAPADLVITASEAWMQALIDSGDVQAQTRRDILSNTLVLVAHGQSRAKASAQILDDPAALRDLLYQRSLAMALVDAVPAGIYGKQALQSLGLWDAVQPRLVQAESVTGALQFAASGAVDFAIVYATDAMGAAHIRQIGHFAPRHHDPIRYPAALTRHSQNPAAAAAFLAYLSMPAAQAIWRAAGFQVLL
jgi:molybdate transport system substrate-binding protein